MGVRLVTAPTTLLDPASAVAASYCLIARLWTVASAVNLDVDAQHPRPCAWEDWSRADLAAMLADFHNAAQYDPRWGWNDAAVQRFRALPADEQKRQVRAAQYPEEDRS